MLPLGLSDLYPTSLLSTPPLNLQSSIMVVGPRLQGTILEPQEVEAHTRRGQHQKRGLRALAAFLATHPAPFESRSILLSAHYSTSIDSIAPSPAETFDRRVVKVTICFGLLTCLVSLYFPLLLSSMIPLVQTWIEGDRTKLPRSGICSSIALRNLRRGQASI